MILLCGDARKDETVKAVLAQLKRLKIGFTDVLSEKRDVGSRRDDEDTFAKEQVAIIIVSEDLKENIDALYYMDVIKKLHNNGMIHVITAKCKSGVLQYPSRFKWLENTEQLSVITAKGEYSFLLRIIYLYLIDIYDTNTKIVDFKLQNEANFSLESELSTAIDKLTGFLGYMLGDYLNINDSRPDIKIMYMRIIIRYIICNESVERELVTNVLLSICEYIELNAGVFRACGMEEQYIMEICFLLAFNSFNLYN